jgi:hypothetical protein
MPHQQRPLGHSSEAEAEEVTMKSDLSADDVARLGPHLVRKLQAAHRFVFLIQVFWLGLSVFAMGLAGVNWAQLRRLRAMRREADEERGAFVEMKLQLDVLRRAALEQSIKPDRKEEAKDGSPNQGDAAHYEA